MTTGQVLPVVRVVVVELEPPDFEETQGRVVIREVCLIAQVPVLDKTVTQGIPVRTVFSPADQEISATLDLMAALPGTRQVVVIAALG
jgi:hypothetical protein